MLDKLIDVLLSVVSLFQFWVVINEYERGIVLRFGCFQRELEPGFHWCIPFRVDYVLVDNVVNRVIELGAQSLTTSDGRDITVNAVVTASIKHIKKALLEAENVDHAITDACAGAVGDYVKGASWVDLRAADANESLTKECRANAFRYGIEIHRVQLKDLTRCRALRILTSGRNDALDIFKQKERLG